MKLKRDRVRKKTFGHIEQELYFYHDTKKEIANIRDEILHGSKGTDNPEGGKSNLPGAPTESKAIRLMSNKALLNMQEVIEAIDEVYKTSYRGEQKFIEAFYWTKPQTLTIEGIAQHLFISKRTLYRLRHRVVHRLAMELGWW